jgi:hypothetical protein
VTGVCLHTGNSVQDLWLDDRSRVTGDCHARICEDVGARLPCVTRLIVYAVVAAIPGTRIVGYGLLIHIILDGLDCVWILN